MAVRSAVDSLTGIIFGGVAMTAAALEHATGGHDLTFTQWRAILLVGETEDGCRIGEVAHRLLTSVPATSRLLRRLERRGLLTLQRDEADRRATRARLTPEGAELRKAVLAYRRREVSKIVREVRPSTECEVALAELADRFASVGR